MVIVSYKNRGVVLSHLLKTWLFFMNNEINIFLHVLSNQTLQGDAMWVLSIVSLSILWQP